MQLKSVMYTSQLRRELTARSRLYAAGRSHVVSYGSRPAVVFAPDGQSHGNFFASAYDAIVARPEWLKRFNKIHAQGRALPRSEDGRRWRELDSCMSSDALLMNVFCTPGVAESAAVKRMLGIDAADVPQFGWKARVPLKSGLFDRTEVDMRWGNLLVEAKLTESDFQTRKASIVAGYRDVDVVFDREALPRVNLRTVRRVAAVELAEEFTQEWEDTAGLLEAEVTAMANAHQASMAARAWEAVPSEAGFAGYQLIRNVLAAYAHGCSFCVIHDERRPDLHEAWFGVMAAVKTAEMRTRCKVLTWQELAEVLPRTLQDFLDVKYGIVAPGKIPSVID